MSYSINMDNISIFRMPCIHFLLQFKNLFLHLQTLTAILPKVTHLVLSPGSSRASLWLCVEPAKGSLLGKKVILHIILYEHDNICGSTIFK